MLAEHVQFCGDASGDRTQVLNECYRVQGFLRHRHFRFGGVTGFRDYVFGYRAGPACTVGNLLHEIAHCAQLGSHELRRVDRYGWGFHVPTRVVMGHVCHEPSTWEGSRREAETAAIQAILGAHLFNVTPSEIIASNAKASVFLVDHINVPGKGERGRIETFSRWAHRDMGGWDVESIRRRFSRNLDIIMESRDR